MRPSRCVIRMVAAGIAAGCLAGWDLPSAAAGDVAFGSRHEMRVDGKLFLPVHAWAVAQADLDRLQAMGVNVAFLCGDAGMEWTTVSQESLGKIGTWLDEVGKRQMYAVLSVAAWWTRPERRGILADKGVEAFIDRFKGHPALLGWLISLEDDMGIGRRALQEQGISEWRPKPGSDWPDIARRYQTVKKADPKHPAIVMYSGGQMLAGDRKFDWAYPTPEKWYLEASKVGDILYHDLFPVANNTADDIKQIADATKLLAKYSGGAKHLWVAVDAGDRKRWTTRSHAPTGEEIRCELWQAVVHGAHGLGFDFTSWKPTWASIRMSEDGEKGLTEAVRQIQQLKEVILLGERPEGLSAKSPTGTRVDALLCRHEKKNYVFAVNVEVRACPAEIGLPSTRPKGATAKVIGEDRTVEISGGTIKDTFAPRAVHLYEIEE